jgi:cell pole-organizing protein PopZ
MADAKDPQNGAAADPSMEDILASIRRILNEDDAAPAAAPAAAAPPPAPVPMTPPPLATPGPAVPMTPGPDPTEVLQLTESMLVQPPPPAGGLLDATAAAAAAASMGQLMRTVAADRGAAVYRGGPTIEDVVREELRPLLKSWLDAHLPSLVERLVRAEIERVVGRAVN